ncbi:MAG: hypothetical protein EHM70_01685 [Chloroflexota bacterium]|nr:MAG: hypothetical protein EHM70_01685 [Chloroflexota bacterium]
MLEKIFNHFRLTWRLVLDPRVSGTLKAFLVGLPLVYAVLPLPLEVPDVVPLIGLIDDMLFLSVTTLIFNALCPRPVVESHEVALGLRRDVPRDDLEVYRNPSENRDLAIGFALIVLIMLVVGALVGVIMLLIFGASYLISHWERGRMLGNAVQITEHQLPNLHESLVKAQAGLPPVKVNLFVLQNPSMNAYTFGYNEPYTIVLTSGLVERLEPDELQAVIGHEIGHILFGHVTIISIMATSITGLERLVFYRWSRSCEYSADAVALLASSWQPEPVISALLKLTSGLKDVQIDLDVFLSQVDESNKSAANSAEFLSTHPFIHNRIKRLVWMAANTKPPLTALPEAV